MRIAFINYEYPPDTAFGGIATSVYQMARAWNAQGHQAEVFTASHERSGTEVEDGILVHRILEPGRARFSEHIAPVFAARHAACAFDVLEGPEYGADAREAVSLVPDIPLVVRLRTPSRLACEINEPSPSLSRRVRKSLGRVRRSLGVPRRPINDRERAHAMDADEIVAPTWAIRHRLRKEWDLDVTRLAVVPYAYTPSPDLLSIPVETRTSTVTFVGRLEIGKGVLDLAAAVPSILCRHSNVKIRFVGRPRLSPDPKLDMRQYLERMLARYRGSLEFTGHVAHDRIAQELAATDVCVFPSHWENFGFVCLEAMTAARGVVASSTGGMAELLDGGKVGRLVAPHRPKRLAAVVNGLLDAPELRMQLGHAARERALHAYTVERFIDLQAASYHRAIARRQQLGSRRVERLESQRRAHRVSAPMPAAMNLAAFRQRRLALSGRESD